MDQPGIYPIIVIITVTDLSHNCNYNGYYTSNMETRQGKLFNYFQQIETMYQEKLTCLANIK